MSHPLFDRLAAGPLLVDGAMGTMLYAAGASLDEAFDLLTLSQPDQVLGVHRAYLEAGADIIETNTFGANRLKLEPFGYADRVREVNRKAVRLAREAREISGRSCADRRVHRTARAHDGAVRHTWSRPWRAASSGSRWMPSSKVASISS